MTSRVVPFGDRAFLVGVDSIRSAQRMAATLDRLRRTGQAPGGIDEVVVGFTSVVMTLDSVPEVDAVVERWLTDQVRRLDRDPGSDHATPGATAARRVVLPVTFDGPDLDAVAGTLGMSRTDVVGLLVGADLEVALLGFAPGFPYLTGLPPELAAVRRRDTPRVSVPAGSVAVAGGYASVYPRTTPGGWRLLGRCSVALFDPDRPPYALLRPGDTVRFTELAPHGTVTAPDGPAADGGPSTRPRPTLQARGGRFVEVLDPGLLSLVEDGGRRGLSAVGIPRAGPADPDAMRLANRLVGNADDDATIEVTAVGPRLRFSADAHLAVVPGPDRGPEVRIDDRPVGPGTVIPVGRGQVVSVGQLPRGLRAYLAVSGGFHTPAVVGARSTDLLSGLGPGALVAGDRLDLGPPTRPRGQLLAWPGPPAGPRSVRVVEGPHLPPGTGTGLVSGGPFSVGEASNRIGVRLTAADPARLPVLAGIPSTPMITGAVQLPPDGNPIILLPDHATVGGYPVVACVITADLAVVGQLRPGDTLVFVPVDRAAAHREWARHERRLTDRVTGWFPTGAGT